MNENNNALTIDDLMSEDHVIYVAQVSSTIVEITITNEEGDISYSRPTHVHAWDSLVSFARQVITSDTRLSIISELIE